MENKSLVVTVPNSFVSATLGEISNDVDLVEWDMTGPSPVQRIDIVIPP